MGKGKRAETWSSQNMHPTKATNKWEGYHNYWGPTQGEGPSPSSGSPAQCTCMGKTNFHDFWLCKSAGLRAGKPKSSGKLKHCSCTDSLQVSMQRQQPEKHLSHKEGDGQYWLLLGCRRAGSGRTFPRGRSTCGHIFIHLFINSSAT